MQVLNLILWIKREKLQILLKLCMHKIERERSLNFLSFGEGSVYVYIV
jgi:hypothetical protein